ncbi:class IV adenylate cyclase [Proteus mirabilis]|uniref:class IV adenylate cyclase n=2 Tax=Proteus TaxID=583 RepID=UPI0010734530|nr:class IV adenylate cyclase [Proteus mirabilis]EKW2646526.1 class IV adenylate cyclase [Proteus mirabilis]MBS3845831.1 class IV adenylate cyclase [Proteus mirabilis]MCW4520099.1 class IV adenylate cyclase [Proteus mirabilis]MDF7361205.1 class IV adenylate cyclase [Proteus mirabilis]MEC4044129.1 class IV adenylate cyclase [Proteus mirabilis]
MSEHFQGKFEAELKYHLKRPQDFIDALQLAGATLFISKNDETDCYLEHPNTPFPAPSISLCVRKMIPSGINLLIVKGPEQAQCEAVKIEDAEKTVSMFKTLGYHCILNYTKSRQIYFLEQFHITIDKLDNLGYFAEFAIMTDDESKLADYKLQLHNLAYQFGFNDSEQEHHNYKTMLLSKLA